MKNFFFKLIFALLFSSSFAQTVAIIPQNSSWKYLDNGTDQGTNWRTTSFNDTFWATGNAELGYGDGGEATILSYGSSTTSRYITSYFRKTFSVANPSLYSSFTLSLLRDDGAVVFLNGVEVARSNMPTGNILNSSLATTEISGTSETNYFNFSINPSLFVIGNNVLAVELHQATTNNIDLSFNLKLNATTASCGTPISLNASSIATASAILSWLSIPSITSYNIRYRRTGTTTWTNTTSTTSSKSISGLLSATAYEFQVKAVCLISVGTYSASANFTTLPPFCGTPNSLTTSSITTSSASLSWQAVSGATSYTIQYRPIGSNTWTITTSSTTSKPINNLVSATAYEFQVQALCIATSVFSASANFSTLVPTCEVPSGLSSSNTTISSSSLSWQAVVGATSYNIQYKPTISSTWSTVNTTNTNIDLNNLVAATAYEFQVQALCIATSIFSASANFSTLVPTCEVPSGLSASNTTISSTLLSWQVVVGATSYKIQYRSIGSEDWRIVTSSNTSKQINNLLFATAYEFQVQALCLVTSDFSASVNFSTLVPTCEVPSGLSATNSTFSSASLSWQAVIGASSYTIQYKPTASSTWSTINTTNTNIDLTNLLVTTDYEFQVQALCLVTSAFSASANFSTLQPTCGVPSNLNATLIGVSSAVLSWQIVSDATNYTIRYRRIGTSTWNIITSTASTKSLTGLLQASSYEFQVQAQCLSLSEYSASVNFTTLTPGTSFLFPANSSWMYLDNGTDQGTVWRNTTFNDTLWKTGTAEFGYGDGDETTLVNYGSDASNKYVTTYFRKTFTINNPLDFSTLSLDVVRDDGVIVYVNGTEVYRNNLPTTTVNYYTQAINSMGGVDETNWLSTVLSPSLFIAGTNVVAVEIHQQSIASSDISFNARLSATIPATCGTPDALSATSIGSSSATINWQVINGATSYTIQYRQVGSIDWIVTSASSNIKVLTGLIPTTSYEFQVQAVCSLSSPFSNLFSFITVENTACGTPTLLKVASASSSTITLSWNEVEGASSYTFEYQIGGTNNWTSISSSTTSKTIIGLIASTTYEFRVKALCALSGENSPVISYTTYSSGINYLFPANSSWMYLDNGTDQGTVWRNTTFNDTLWKTGTAEFGYGDGDETTLVNYGSDASNKYVTTYFRKTFTINNPLDFSALSLDVVRDDGVIVYVNGTEVYRNNLPTTTVNYNTQAINSMGGSDETNWLSTVLSPSLFIAGTNVVAIEIHQQSASSSDISFNARLSGTIQTICSTPDSLNATLISSSSATLNWQAINGASTYTIQYRQVGNADWIVTSSTTNTKVLTRLTPSTSYEFQVQAVCSFSSSFSNSFNFITTAITAICDAPTSLKIESITSSIITLTWNEVASVTSYVIDYRIAGTNNWMTTTATETTKTITGLIASTNYEFIVKAMCSYMGEDSNTLSFTTYASGLDFLIAPNSSWKFLDNGTNQGTQWKDKIFDDTLWKTGNAEFGYGDGDETTLVDYGTNASNKYVTTYFRKTFSVNNPLDYNALSLDIIRDDGVVVYLNGIEVFRNNLPTTTINYNTLALDSDVDETNWLINAISPSLLIAGINVLAVEIHQQSTSSSDISFNARLTSPGNVIFPVLTRGAYLQKVTSNSITVRWRTNVPCNTFVQFGTSLTYGSSVSDSALVTDHEITLTGLTPNTKYFYSIGTTSNVFQGNLKNNFYTAPIVGSSTPVRIWGIGDFGSGGTKQLKVRNAYTNYAGTTPTNLWIWFGDDAYNNGLDSEYQRNVFDQYLDQFKNMPLYPTMGDHDYADSGYQSTASLSTNFPYFTIFSVPQNGESGGVPSNSPKYYSYNYANIHFITLDGYGSFNDPTSPMYIWLNNDLAANTQRWTVVYMHIPPYSLGSHSSDSEYELINMRTNIVPLLENYKVDLVLSGHSHVNERSYLIKGHYDISTTFTPSMKVSQDNKNFIKNANNEGTVYAVCGTSAVVSTVTEPTFPMQAMYFNNSSNECSLVIDVNGDSLSCKYLASTGVILDDFSINKTAVAPRVSQPQPQIKDEPKDFFNVEISKNSLNINYSLNETSEVKMELITLLGETFITFNEIPSSQPKGFYNFEIPLTRKYIADGLYFMRMTINGKTYVKKVYIDK